MLGGLFIVLAKIFGQGKMIFLFMHGFLKCDDATRLLSEKQDRKLSLGLRLRLWFHMIVCSMCKGYDRYLAKLRAATQKMQNLDNRASLGDGLPPQARQRIQESLHDLN